MDPTDGARSFLVSGDAYDSFMGRYSRPLAVAFADWVGVVAPSTALDCGCGPGALTGVLVDRLGADSVSAFDPSEPFVAACSTRHPGVEIRDGRAEDIPFDDGRFDLVLCQLVLHFVTEPAKAAQEFRRVARPGGVVAACVWDFEQGMEMLRHFWDAALTIDPDAPDEARTLRFGRDGEIVQLLEGAGFEAVAAAALTVTTSYSGFDELWSGFLAGIGPAGAYCVGLGEGQQAALRGELFDRLGAPAGPFTLSATARSASGRSPD